MSKEDLAQFDGKVVDALAGGIYKIELGSTGKQVTISMNWVSLEDQAFASQFSITPDSDW